MNVNGCEFLIDDCDIPLIKGKKIRLGGNGYIYANSDMLHRLIMNPPEGMFVDHINHNKVDNRRCNLRLVTPLQNAWNASKAKRSSQSCHSKFKGVTKGSKGWCVVFMCNGKYITDGSYRTELEAAVKYNELAKKAYGEYACPNEFSTKETELIKKLSFRKLGEDRLKKSPFHGVSFSKAKQRWGWRFMYKGNLYYDQYCESAVDAKNKLIAFLKKFDGKPEIMRWYPEYFGDIRFE